MSSPFQTEQMTLAQLFSGQHIFSFPAFQRPYRWTEEEALTLIDDVAAASQRGDEGYFLGNLVLTPHNGPASMVIDGRQRLTTLFMLICIIRDLERDKRRAKGLHRLIYDDATDETPGGWRLRFPEAEQSLIESRLAAIERPAEMSAEEASLSVRYLSMFEVAEAMRDLLTRPNSETYLPRLEDFTDYLLNQCEVIVLTASSATSGLRLFQVLNNRGLQLSEADLIKPDLLQMLPPARQGEAALIWDGLEDKLGTDHLDTLLRCYIFIMSGEWVPAGRNFAPSLKAAMMVRGADAFHFEDLPRYGAAFADMHWGDIPYDEPNQNPNHLIQGLYFLGRNMNEWKEFLPLAMEILVRFDGHDGEIYRHMSALDRTFFVWFINETSEDARRRVSYDMIGQIQSGDDLFAPGKGFDTPQRELDKAIAALETPFPKLYQRGALIRRIELKLCERDGKAAPQYLELSTAEHVLPRNPRPGSQWTIDFTRAEHRECLDLLGNGMPLTREIDKRVGNRDYNAKRSIYRDTGVDRYFKSVADVCASDVWTPAEIRMRTSRLAEMMAETWRNIPVDPIPDDDEFDDPEEDEAVSEEAQKTAGEDDGMADADAENPTSLQPQIYADIADEISRQIDEAVKDKDD